MNEPRLHIFVCTNIRDSNEGLPSCGAEGTAVFDAIRRAVLQAGLSSLVKVTSSGCLTPCNHGPNVVVYPEGVWYCGVTPADAKEIVDIHASGEGNVHRLLMPPLVRLL